MRGLYIRGWTLLAIGVLRLGKYLPPVEGENNCAAAAVRGFFDGKGVALALMRSRYQPDLHFQLVTRDGIALEWEPDEPKRKRARAPLLFRGTWRVGVVFDGRVRLPKQPT